MSEVNLPHDHGQNIEKVLERMPDTDECVVAVSYTHLTLPTN